jgi:hypothetical protein
MMILIFCSIKSYGNYSLGRRGIHGETLFELISGKRTEWGSTLKSLTANSTHILHTLRHAFALLG